MNEAWRSVADRGDYGMESLVPLKGLQLTFWAGPPRRGGGRESGLARSFAALHSPEVRLPYLPYPSLVYLKGPIETRFIRPGLSAGFAVCNYCCNRISPGKPAFPCISCDDMVYCDTSCQFEDSTNHAPDCTENRLTLGSTVIELQELREAINAFITPRHRFLAPTALRAILRPSSNKAEERTLDSHFLLLEFVPSQHSVQLFSASVQPLARLYAQYRNGEQQRADLMQYAQRFREQYEAAGADVAGTLFIQCRCPSVLGLSNDVTPITIVKWLVDQTRAQPPIEPGWEEVFVRRMNEKAY